MKNLNILQISAPKSGSYWLHSILTLLLEESQIPKRSFIQKQPVFQDLKDKELSFKGMAEVDMMDIEEDGCHYRISSLFREEIKDLQTYAEQTSLAWTHSSLCNKTFEVLPFFKKKIYLVRDPRDRALSSAKFAFTDYMLKHYPTEYDSPEAFLDGEYKRLIRQWVWYTGNYLLHKEELDIHFVFYENLLLDFEKELQSLLNYLNLPLSATQREKIAEAVHFSKMKNESPKHLNKGKFGKWIDQLSGAEKDLAVAEAGELLQILNYPLHASEEKLPRVPQEIPKQKLEKILGQIDWRKLF